MAIIIDILKYQNISETFNADSIYEPFELIIHCNSYLMHDVINNTVGSLHLNKLSELFNDLRSHLIEDAQIARKIIIHFGKDTINFDIAIVGLMALFKQSYPSFLFEIQLPIFDETSSYLRFRDNLSLLKYWYFSFTSCQLFEMKVSGEVKTPTDQLFIFPINVDSFHNYFVSTDSSWEAEAIYKKVDKGILLERFLKFKSEFELYKASHSEFSYAEVNFNILRSLNKSFEKELDFKNNNRLFYQEYLMMLSSFHLAHQQYIQIKGLSKKVVLNSFRRQHFSELAMNSLREKFKPIHSKLMKQPSFLIYLFSFLVNRNLNVLVFQDSENGSSNLDKTDLLISML